MINRTKKNKYMLARFNRPFRHTLSFHIQRIVVAE